MTGLGLCSLAAIYYPSSSSKGLLLVDTSHPWLAPCIVSWPSDSQTDLVWSCIIAVLLMSIIISFLSYWCPFLFDCYPTLVWLVYHFCLTVVPWLYYCWSIVVWLLSRCCLTVVWISSNWCPKVVKASLIILWLLSKNGLNVVPLWSDWCPAVPLLYQ